MIVNKLDTVLYNLQNPIKPILVMKELDDNELEKFKSEWTKGESKLNLLFNSVTDDRHAIQGFTDWLIDNKETISTQTIQEDMEIYLSEISKSRESVKKANDE